MFSAVRRGYLRVRDGACLAINISGHQPIEYSARVTPLHKELGHKAHVDEPHLMREAIKDVVHLMREAIKDVVHLMREVIRDALRGALERNV